ncbi:hypothetical protein [Bradyrhizobium sp. Ec3.3]|nr:hypothetical protein [Bradyrhizobium sp. Ec3.3]
MAAEPISRRQQLLTFLSVEFFEAASLTRYQTFDIGNESVNGVTAIT